MHAETTHGLHNFVTTALVLRIASLRKTWHRIAIMRGLHLFDILGAHGILTRSGLGGLASATVSLVRVSASAPLLPPVLLIVSGLASTALRASFRLAACRFFFAPDLVFP